MTPEERSLLELIDAALRSENVREQIRPIMKRVRAELARKKEALMTWEPVPLNIFGTALPREIRSAWVFVLRAGADTGAERHPNSHQRMMSFEGEGDLQTGEPEAFVAHYSRASASNSAMCFGRALVRSVIWCRQLVPEAMISVPGG